MSAIEEVDIKARDDGWVDEFTDVSADAGRSSVLGKLRAVLG